MPALFKRRARAIVALPYAGPAAFAVGAVVGGVTRPDYYSTSAQVFEIEDLHFTFNVEKNLKNEPNTCECTIYNLSERSRVEFDTVGGKFSLLAGYEDATAMVFYGDVTKVDHSRDGADWVTKIQAGDGQRSRKWARVSQTFKGGALVAEVGRVTGSVMGIDPGNLEEKLAGRVEQYATGHVASGNASREFDKVMLRLGYLWSVQDGRLQVLRPGEATTETIAVLSPSTGLVGSPEHGTATGKGKPATLKARALLTPTILPGRRVQLEDCSAAGLYRVLKVSHSGDTHGSDWFTTLEMEVFSG